MYDPKWIDVIYITIDLKAFQAVDSNLVGCVRNSGEFTAIKPDKKAVVAAIDHHISRPRVEMRVHAPIAPGTLKHALQIAAIRWSMHGGIRCCGA